MRVAGIVRRIDELGRVILPKEARHALRLREGDPVEICVEQDRIILRRHVEMDALRALAQVLCDIAAGPDGDQSVLIADRDRVVAGSGDDSVGRVGWPVDDRLLAFLGQHRKPAAVGTEVLGALSGPGILESAAVAPIVTGDGEVVGAVIMSSVSVCGVTCQALRKAELIARYLSRQLGGEM